MGNHGSKKKSRKNSYGLDTDIEDEIRSHFEGLGETTPNSYDKLLAWMMEMAENDGANLESPAFVEQLTTVCAEKRNNLSQLNVPFERQHSYDVPARSKTPIRQYSYDSSTSSRIYNRSPRSREDYLDPRTRFRRSLLSRQATVDYSDDGDGLEVPMDLSSGGSSFEQDSDQDVANPNSVLLGGGYRETSFSKLNINSKPTYNNRHNVMSNSLGDLLSGRNAMNSAVKKKSKSLMTMKRMKSETRTDDEITPIREETVIRVLDDNLLDSNMADILYSVEALWPKVGLPK